MHKRTPHRQFDDWYTDYKANAGLATDPSLAHAVTLHYVEAPLSRHLWRVHMGGDHSGDRLMEWPTRLGGYAELPTAKDEGDLRALLRA